MSSRVCSIVMEYMRANAGVKLTPAQVGKATQLSTQVVSNVLTTRYSRNTSHLQRERLCRDTSHGWVYWITDAEVTPELAGNALRVARWFILNRRAARPSVIAQALSMDVAHVAEQLELWARQGAAVRCELLTRTGFDRFEYRLSEFVSDHFGGNRNPSFGRRIAA